jgi:hypothetical protein
MRGGGEDDDGSDDERASHVGARAEAFAEDDDPEDGAEGRLDVEEDTGA